MVGIYLALGILLAVLLGSEGKNDAYKPQNEFKLDTWISLHIGPFDMSINKAVLYLFLGVRAHDRDLAVHREPHAAAARTGSRPRSRRSTS